MSNHSQLNIQLLKLNVLTIQLNIQLSKLNVLTIQLNIQLSKLNVFNPKTLQHKVEHSTIQN